METPCLSPVRMVATTKLKPHPQNPNRHPERQLELLIAVIRENGFRAPIVTSKRSGLVIKGHARLEAAKRMGLQKVPVQIQDYADEAAENADMIADNRLGELSERDEQAVARLLAGLKPEAAGYTDREARKLMDLLQTEAAATAGITPDLAKELQAKWGTKLGQIWKCGDSRLLCGSCKDAAAVKELMGKHKPRLMVTDPPYGVNYDPTWRNTAGIAKTKRTVAVLNDDQADWTDAWNLFPGDVAYVWHGALHATTVAESMLKAGFEIRSQIIWAKDRFAIGRGNYHWQHEPAWYCVRKGRPSHWNGDRDKATLWKIVTEPDQADSTLWEIGQGDQDMDTAHSTQKPLECMRRPILNNSLQGDAVYEPFNGSGTTLIAATQLQRTCLAIELNPVCVAIALERWQKLTGKEPKA